MNFQGTSRLTSSREVGQATLWIRMDARMNLNLLSCGLGPVAVPHTCLKTIQIIQESNGAIISRELNLSGTASFVIELEFIIRS